jgi:hypothetical protein
MKIPVTFPCAFVALHKISICAALLLLWQDCSFWSDLYLHDIARGALFLELLQISISAISTERKAFASYNSSRYTSNPLALGQHAFHTSLFLNNIHMPVIDVKLVCNVPSYTI